LTYGGPYATIRSFISLEGRAMSDPDLTSRRLRLSVPELTRRPNLALGCCAYPAADLITHNLTLLPQVRFVRCDQEHGEVWVDLEPADDSIDQVMGILAGLGYPAAIAAERSAPADGPAVAVDGAITSTGESAVAGR
jgi:hypothetical protein